MLLAVYVDYIRIETWLFGYLKCLYLRKIVGCEPNLVEIGIKT